VSWAGNRLADGQLDLLEPTATYSGKPIGYTISEESAKMHTPQLRVPVIIILVLGTGFLGALMPPGGVDQAQCAACAKVLPVCQAGDDTLTSALTVGHYDETYTTPVEPDTGETWEIKSVYATYSGVLPPVCACQEVDATVSVDVDWDGTSWSATCTGCNPIAGPIFAVDVCVDDDTDVCSDGEVNHSSKYKLVADVADTHLYYCLQNLFIANLDRVEYRPTSIDDGNVIDAETCAEGYAVTPVGSSYTSVIDYGGWECEFDCDATGASTSLFYEPQ
jgi:hypothetical protein